MAIKKVESITERESDYNDFRKHKDEIRDAANEAKTIIAQAAELAAKAIADAAAISVKVLRVKNADDHDLLIELKTRMEGLREDIKDLHDNVSLRLDDHEKRIASLEKSKDSQTIWVTIGTSLVGILVAIMMYHILK